MAGAGPWELFARLHGGQSAIDVLFAQADTDKDGKLTKAELEAFSQKSRMGRGAGSRNRPADKLRKPPKEKHDGKKEGKAGAQKGEKKAAKKAEKKAEKKSETKVEKKANETGANTTIPGAKSPEAKPVVKEKSVPNTAPAANAGAIGPAKSAVLPDTAGRVTAAGHRMAAHAAKPIETKTGAPAT